VFETIDPASEEVLGVAAHHSAQLPPVGWLRRGSRGARSSVRAPRSGSENPACSWRESGSRLA
jgi:hypothetical protein